MRCYSVALKRAAFFSSLSKAPAKVFYQSLLLAQHSHDSLFEEDFVTSATKHKHPLLNTATQPAVYVGFDPTANSLHLGNLAAIVGLARLSLIGLKPIFLVGGATGYIGDPSGKTTERTMLQKKYLDSNIYGIKSTLERTAHNIADYLKRKYAIDAYSFAYVDIVNNADFYSQMNVIDFIRDVGRYYRINNLLAKESIASRLTASVDGLSFTEFSYTLLQGYDYERLFLEKNCILQVGGSDQWGNIVSGYELIKKKHKHEVFAMTIPLLTNAQGQKFGKSEGNSVWIDVDGTKQNAFDFYQHLYNQADDTALRLLWMLTFIPQNELLEVYEMGAAAFFISIAEFSTKYNQLIIIKIKEYHLAHPEKRLAQKILAETLLEMLLPPYSGTQTTMEAVKISQRFFYTDFTKIEYSLSTEEASKLFADCTSITIALTLSEYESFTELAELLAKLGLKKSRAEARREIESGAVYLKDYRITTEEAKDLKYLRLKYAFGDGKYLVLRLGRKKYHIIKIETET